MKVTSTRMMNHRIAVFRALFLGDMLVAVPALRSLRAKFPKSEISLIGLPWAREFARRLPDYIDRFVPFPGYPGLVETPADPEESHRFVVEQRSYGYDLVVQLHGSGRVTSPLAVRLGGRVTAGFYEDEPPAGLDIALRYPNEGHEISRNLALVKELGCPDTGTNLELQVLPEDEIVARELLEPVVRTGGAVVGLHPGSSLPVRRWPKQYFAALGDRLASDFDAQVVLTGGSGERQVAAAVGECMRAPATNLAGLTSVGALASVLARLGLFVTNDTGPAHLAVAVGVPSITLFGPGDRDRWAPLDTVNHRIAVHPVRCSPCWFRQCPIDHRCLQRLTPEAVGTMAADMLGRGDARMIHTGPPAGAVG